MQSLKSKIILGMMVNRHLFKGRLRKEPFDPSPEGVRKLRQQTENGAQMFGKLPSEVEIIEDSIDGMYVEWLKIAVNNPEKVMLYFHGGMYVTGSPQSHRPHVYKFVKGSGVNALVFDYRLAPEHPFPAALNDALKAYTFILKQGFQPQNIVFAGDSAGGGLCLATLLAIKDKGIVLPAAAAVLSPWTDLALTGESYTTNKEKCLSPKGSSENASDFYAAENDKKNPFISPLYGNLAGLPPLHISAGSNEILRDDSIRFAQKATAAGVEVTLLIGEGMCHCYPAFGNLFRESKLAMSEICNHLKFHINK